MFICCSLVIYYSRETTARYSFVQYVSSNRDFRVKLYRGPPGIPFTRHVDVVVRMKKCAVSEWKFAARFAAYKIPGVQLLRSAIFSCARARAREVSREWTRVKNRARVSRRSIYNIHHPRKLVSDGSTRANSEFFARSASIARTEAKKHLHPRVNAQG